ncbi:hypothetical protein [Escherichia coli]|nr:hypothetical protein [Escherichia coli]
MYAKHRGSSVYHACVADFCQLAASKDKECDGQPPQYAGPEGGKPGKMRRRILGAWLDDALAGGASVVAMGKAITWRRETLIN